MIKLIKNEIIKIFSKKSMIVIGVLITAVILISNISTKIQSQNSNSTVYSDEIISYYDEKLAQLDPEKPANWNEYIELKTERDMAELAKDYTYESWEYAIISQQIQPVISQINNYRYGENKEEEKLKEVQTQYDEMVKSLKEGNWQYFAKKELEDTNKQIEIIQNQLEMDKENTELQMQLKNLELTKQIATIRLEKNICYGEENYPSIALSRYQLYQSELNQYEMTKNLSYEEQKEKNAVWEKARLYAYDVEYDTEFQNTATANYQMQNSINSYVVLIVLTLVILAGAIVSDEFSKGTIKLLLVRPYSRTKILLSKLIAVFVSMAIVTAFILFLQFIIGGFVFGFNTYHMNTMQFDFTQGNVISMNLLVYILLTFVAQLPVLFLIGMLAFALGTIFLSSPLAIALPIFGYMGSEMINMVALQMGWDWIRYFVTPNWNFTQYLFGGLPFMEGTTPIFSLLICSIYFVIMIAILIIIFKKRNIKNV